MYCTEQYIDAWKYEMNFSRGTGYLSTRYKPIAVLTS